MHGMNLTLTGNYRSLSFETWRYGAFEVNYVDQNISARFFWKVRMRIGKAVRWVGNYRTASFTS